MIKQLEPGGLRKSRTRLLRVTVKKMGAENSPAKGLSGQSPLDGVGPCFTKA
jgi:hypothetical protein